jgi:hypothetical protein
MATDRITKRTCAWVCKPPNPMADSGVFRIDYVDGRGKPQSDLYFARPLVSQVGGRAFELIRFSEKTGARRYHLLLAPEKRYDHCECESFVYGKFPHGMCTCKHIKAMRALLDGSSDNEDKKAGGQTRDRTRR